MNRTKITDADVKIGIALKTHRISKQLTQSEIAKIINVTTQQIQKYEKGVRKWKILKAI